MTAPQQPGQDAGEQMLPGERRDDAAGQLAPPTGWPAQGVSGADGSGPQEVTDAEAEQHYRDEVTRHLFVMQARAEARRLLDAQDRQPLRLVPAAEVRKRQKPPDLVEGMIPAASVGVMFGDTGVYKSFLVLNLQLCVGARSAAFLGHMVNSNGGGWAVYVMGEGLADAGERLDAAVTAHPGFSDDRLAYIEQAFPLSDEAAVDEVIAECRTLAERSGTPVLLMVFDSFADFYGAADSENSATDMQRLIASMKRIRDAVGCTVMANAHTGHGGQDENGEARPMRRQRGTSRFRQAWDFELMATGTDLVCQKNRYGQEFPPVRYGVARHGGTLVIAGPGTAGPGDTDGEYPPHPLEALSAAEERVLADVIAYVREHGSETPLSFRRIDQGTKGRQAAKRRMLDLAAGIWLDEAKMPGGHQGYSYPGGFIRWHENVARDMSPVSPL